MSLTKEEFKQFMDEYKKENSDKPAKGTKAALDSSVLDDLVKEFHEYKESQDKGDNPESKKIEDQLKEMTERAEKAEAEYEKSNKLLGKFSEAFDRKSDSDDTTIKDEKENPEKKSGEEEMVNEPFFKNVIQ